MSEHFHIVPRREDDGLHLPWTDQASVAPPGECPEEDAGCCTACSGLGGGMCWDCRGTGCAHPEPRCTRPLSPAALEVEP